MPMKTPTEQQLVNKELTHKLFSRVEEVRCSLVIYEILFGKIFFFISIRIKRVARLNVVACI